MSLDRRRALMMAGEDSNDILYQLKNRTVVAGETINTSINVFSSGLSVTILFDVNLITNTTSGYGRTWKFLSEYSAEASTWGLRVGKNNAAATQQTLYWYKTQLGLGDTRTSAGRHRYIITHEADSNDVTLLYKKDNEQLLTFTQTSTFVPASANWFYIGSGANTDNALPPCVINDLTVYNRILSQAEINAFFA